MSVASTTDDPTAPGTSAHHRGWTLAMVCIATFMLMLDVTVVNVALPQIRLALDASFSDLQWVIDAYTLTLAVFLLTSGSLADRFGRRRLFLVGLLVFTVTSLAAGLAPNVLVLHLSRGVQGLGAAILFAVGPALIGQEFRGAKDRGFAFGIFGGVAGLALAFGPVIGGLITDVLDWRWIFLVNVPIGVFCVVTSLVRLRESREEQAHRVDYAGAILLAVALGLLILAFLRGEATGWTSVPIVTLFVIAALGFVAFVALEYRRGRTAMLDLSLFRIRTFSGVTTSTFLSNATSLAAVFLLVSYMQNILGYSPLETGLRFMPMMFTLFVFAALTGALANNVAPGLLIGVSIGLIAIGLGLVTLVEPGSSWTVLLPSMIVTGIGMGIFNPPRAAVTIGVVDPARAGMASGTGETFQQVGIAVGIAAFGALFQARVVEGFTSSPVAAVLGPQVEPAARAVAAGGTQSIGQTVPPELAAQAAAAAREAFVTGMTSTIAVTAVFAAIGSLIAFATIRRSDLHESALTETENLAGAHTAPA